MRASDPETMPPYANKSLGQHFLKDPQTADRIAQHAQLTGEETVLEIGPGHGILTRALVRRARRVIAIELDAALARALPQSVPAQNLEVLHADALDVEWPRFDACVSNLPYNVSTPILFKLLETPGWSRAVLMVQKEFAQRMSARVDTPEYGRLTVEVAYRARVEHLQTLPPGAFQPPPKVHSSVVKLVPHATPPVTLRDEGMFHSVVQAAFAQRRKKLANALANARHLLPSGTQVPTQLPHAGRRAGELGLAEFAQVSNALTPA